MDSVFQYYKGIDSKASDDQIERILWTAEQQFAENVGGGDLETIQSFVCAFVTKWMPYNASDYLRVYLKDSPYKEKLAVIYELLDF